MTYTYDVVVAGGGTAGSVAAVAAAREGARVLCFEQFGALGGTSTLGLVTPLMPFRIGDRWLVRGIHEEIVEATRRASDDGDGIFFNPERLKYVLEELAVEAGVELLYHTVATAAHVEDGRLVAVEVHNKSGRHILEAACFIDATGDADIAAYADVPFESGRPEDGLNQSASLRFIMAGVDWDALTAWLNEPGVGGQPPRLHLGFTRDREVYPWMEELLERAVADGVFVDDEAGYFQFFTLPGRPGEAIFNCPRLLRINGTRAEDLT
ncbi:MAG: FAD-dependent oxidoreductase, partial [Armatimonadetes bacterium]|nr:FAD-dependent oxidoreductase [Armatimonadota bacterium]